MNQFDTAYSKCILSLNSIYHVGDFDKMLKDSEVWDKMLRFEAEINKLWGEDYTTFHAVLVEYYKFMRNYLKGGQ